MDSMSMSMTMPVASATSMSGMAMGTASAAASATSAPAMAMDMGGGCKISVRHLPTLIPKRCMLIRITDVVELERDRHMYFSSLQTHMSYQKFTHPGFISSTWRIQSHGMFAGSCIGVVLLVMSLEFLRRLGKEYDRHILRQHQRTQFALQQSTPSPKSASLSDDKNAVACATLPLGKMPIAPFRPNVVQQLVRALLHMVQFAVAYFVMLLAMYYNGYFIICIFIGAFLGAFVFSWETVEMG